MSLLHQRGRIEPLVVPKPTIDIYTDKTTYTKNDSMCVGLNVVNPGDALQVRLRIWLETPPCWTIIIKNALVTLPADLKYSNPNFMVFKSLPNLPAGKYVWHAALIDPKTGKIICTDTAQWQFVKTAEAPPEDIDRMLEQAIVDTDFGE